MNNGLAEGSELTEAASNVSELQKVIAGLRGKHSRVGLRDKKTETVMLRNAFRALGQRLPEMKTMMQHAESEASVSESDTRVAADLLRAAEYLVEQAGYQLMGD